LEAHLYPDFPFGPPSPTSVPSAYWVGPRHLAGDDGRLYDVVADTFAGLGWTSLAIVRGRQEPDEAPEDRQILRSTVLHISPDSLRWAQWVLPDEPFHLGNSPIAWQVSARTDLSSPLAQWSAYFTPEVPGEVLADFLAALDARDQPALSLGGPELVLDAVTARGWLRDVDQPGTGAVDPTFASHVRLGEVPPLIQDGDPIALVVDADEAALAGWQAWAEPVLGAGYLWAASFSTSVPHDLVPRSPVRSVPARRCCVGCCRRAHATGSCALQPAECFPRIEAGPPSLRRPGFVLRCFVPASSRALRPAAAGAVLPLAGASFGVAS
jgi:hypothetical protein